VKDSQLLTLGVRPAGSWFGLLQFIIKVLVQMVAARPHLQQMVEFHKLVRLTRIWVHQVGIQLAIRARQYSAQWLFLRPTQQRLSWFLQSSFWEAFCFLIDYY